VDKQICLDLHNEGYHINYIGVDSSMPMLIQAKKNMETLTDISSIFCHADITQLAFLSFLQRHQKPDTTMIFLFL
jgi:ubiquinone/menaquinone biosynthesis C-methylase UbiE